MRERTNRILVAVLVVAGILFLALVIRNVAAHHRQGRPIVAPAVPTPKPLRLTENETAQAAAHPIKIGGVHSVKELLNLINSDPGVAAHYRVLGFRPECASTMVLAVSTFARVSYRTDTGFAWTQRPVLLLGGEDLIVDCEGHIIRAKCANAVELVEKGPEFPTDGQPVGTLIPPSDLPPVDVVPPIVPPTTPVPRSLPPGAPPVYPPSWCCIVPFPPGGPVPPQTPKTSEPSLTWMLVGGWILVLGLHRIFFKREPR